MTILKDIYNSFFEKNYESVWRQFASENKGIYITGRYDNLDSVEITYLNHKIVFDRYIHYQSIGGQSHDTEFTRVRLTFQSPDNLKLRLTKQGLMDNISKLFGGQDIQIGDKEFDKRFMIKGTDEYKIKCSS